MSNHDKVSRRKALAAIGGATATGLAGCLGGGGNPEQNDTGGPEEPETNPNKEDTNQNSTNGNEGEQEPGSETDLSGLLEEGDDERYIGDPSYRGILEKKQEESLSNENIDELDTSYWIEFHNPEQQIPVDDGVIDEYPALRVFEEGNYDNPFTTYMIWGEGENGKTQLAAVQVGQETDDGVKYVNDIEAVWEEKLYQDWEYPEEADVQGILEDVVRSVSDVPKELETEYGDILREKQD
jgi:hypothetical protein